MRGYSQLMGRPTTTMAMSKYSRISMIINSLPSKIIHHSVYTDEGVEILGQFLRLQVHTCLVASMTGIMNCDHLIKMGISV